MTYRVFNQADRLVKIAIPIFVIVGVLLAFAFKGTIVAATNEKTGQDADITSIELTYLGYNL
ncbi:hypothetical protein JW823_05580 [bacterium]|nr:hypothetical protein [candidate division CSSED10-310 bacterium]